MKTLDPKAIASHFGGDVTGKQQVNIPTPGHSKRDRGTSITLKPDAPDGVVVHCHNGSPSDALAVKDQLRNAGFLPKFERAEVWRNDDLRPARVADEHAVHLSPGQRIVATFEYIDLDGHVRFRTHRIEPGRNGTSKEFRYDRPSGGAWLPGLGDELQLPYGLTSVAFADGAADLYLVEGERKADKLISWGLQALSLKNIDKWFDRFAGFFKGRRVFILPDNDDAGERYAAKAAELIGSSASIVRLPGLADGRDILDWDGGLADLLALSSEAHDPSPSLVDTGTFPEPVDLWMRYEEPDLPKGLLPEVIERFAFRQGEIMGADPAGLAMASLTVCAAAIPDSVALQVKRNDPTWRENARLWTALVGPPSRKKTPIFKAALAPLRSLDNALMRTFMQSLSAYEALPAAERKMAERPKQKRLIISDATVEAAQEVLRDSPEGLLH